MFFFVILLKRMFFTLSIWLTVWNNVWNYVSSLSMGWWSQFFWFDWDSIGSDTPSNRWLSWLMAPAVYVLLPNSNVILAHSVNNFEFVAVKTVWYCCWSISDRFWFERWHPCLKPPSTPMDPVIKNRGAQECLKPHELDVRDLNGAALVGWPDKKIERLGGAPNMVLTGFNRSWWDLVVVPPT